MAKRLLGRRARELLTIVADNHDTRVHHLHVAASQPALQRQAGTLGIRGDQDQGFGGTVVQK